MDKQAGHYAFVAGVLIALALGLANSAGVSRSVQTGMILILVLLGIVVGAMNITGKETMDFLLSSTALVIVASLSVDFLRRIAYVGLLFVDVINAIIAFTVPAIIVVAVKNITRLAKDK